MSNQDPNPRRQPEQPKHVPLREPKREPFRSPPEPERKERNAPSPDKGRGQPPAKK